MDRMEDRDRLRTLYQEHWRALFGYACRRADSVEDAADVVSEVFLTAWRRIGEVPAGSQARLWLFGVARLTIQNQLRSRDRRDRLGAALLEAFTERHGDDPSRYVERDHDAHRVRRALDQLPETDRELICLIAWEQLSPGDAAAVLGINAVTARTRLSRARRKLRLLLDDDALPQMHLIASPDGGTNR